MHQRPSNHVVKGLFIIIFVISMLTILAMYDVIVLYRAKSQINDADTPEARHVAFLKVHKTGSSTVQNIFLRFGYNRNLTFILASVKNNDCRGMYNCISFFKTLNDDLIVPAPVNRPFEIMCSHVVYNRNQFRKYLPRDTRLIAIVREPVSRLESAIAFFRLLKDAKLSKFVNDPFRFENPKLNNVMAFEFGFKQEWFPNSSHVTYTAADMIGAKKYARQVVNDFELILLNECLDESLVLMKRTLGWRTEDIVYHSKLSREHEKFKGKDIDKLKRYLYLDYLIYDMAVEKFEQKIAESGSDFEEEVKEFKVVNGKVVEFCSSPGKKVLTIESTKWHSEFVITEDFCSDLMRKEGDFFDIIRLRQYGTLNTY